MPACGTVSGHELVPVGDSSALHDCKLLRALLQYGVTDDILVARLTMLNKGQNRYRSQRTMV